MFEQFMQIAASYGIWAAMFLGLLIYLLADSRKREARYQQTVEKLADRLAVVHDIKEELKELREQTLRVKRGGKNEKKIQEKKLWDQSCGRGDFASAAVGCEG